MYEKKKALLLPKYSQYFKEESICHLIPLYPDKPDIAYILDFFVDPEIIDVKAIKTITATSEEGIKLTGTKLLVRVKLNQKLTYANDSRNHSVHGLRCEHYTNLSVILPNEIDGNNVIDLVNCNRIKASVYLESNHCRLFSKREIFNCSLLFVDVKISI